MKPRLLDLFCGAGGAGMGYHRAGFAVVGVDIVKQKHYPFEFHQADAMTYPLDGFDAIHASPPCQGFTDLKSMWNAREHPDLLTPTRARLKERCVPYVIENVPGAPLKATFMLCGTMFDLGCNGAELWRHRYFETSFRSQVLIQGCKHYSRGKVIGVYGGGHGRDRRHRHDVGITYREAHRVITVTGHSGGSSVRDGTQQFSTNQRKQAMGIDWMTGAELSQAIPPAFTEFIGKQLMTNLEARSKEAP